MLAGPIDNGARGVAFLEARQPPPRVHPPGGILVAGAIVGLVGLLALNGLAEPPPHEHALIEPTDGLVCLLVNKNSGRCLSVAGGAANPGAKVVQGPTPEQAGPAERWTLLQTGKAFRLRNEHSRLVLEIGGANPNPGVNAIQWHDQVNRSHQLWTFERLGDDYLLRPGHGPFVLTIGQGSHEEGAGAVQWAEIPDIPEELWDLRSAADPLRPESPAAPGGGPAADPSGSSLRGLWKLWLVAPLPLALAVGVWLAVRQRRREEKRVPTPEKRRGK